MSPEYSSSNSEEQSGSPAPREDTLKRSLWLSLVGVVYVARRVYQRLAFSATPFPAENMLVLNTSSVGVRSVSKAKEEEESEGDVRLILSALSL